MSVDSYKHVVEIDEQSSVLSIYRELGDGKKELYTSIDLPQINAHENWDSFEVFAKQLGENILMDSPAARKLLSL